MLQTDSHSDSDLRRFYTYKRIAVVGMSKNPEKPSHYVPKYLLDEGFTITPVNPTADSILGLKSHPLVSSIKEQIDIVDIFRPSDDVLSVISDVIQKEGIKVIWMQKDIYNKEAEQMAREKGIEVVFNRCMLEEHKRLFA